MSSKVELNQRIAELEQDNAVLAREYRAAVLGAQALLKTIVVQSRQIAALRAELAEARRPWWRRAWHRLRGRRGTQAIPAPRGSQRGQGENRVADPQSC